MYRHFVRATFAAQRALTTAAGSFRGVAAAFTLTFVDVFLFFLSLYELDVWTMQGAGNPRLD